MKNLLAPLILVATICTTLLVADGAYHAALGADAGTPTAQVDAGAGSASASATVPVIVAHAPDPTAHPKDAYDYEVATYKQGGLLLAIVLGLYLLAAGLGKYASKGSLLDRGRWPVIIAAATSTLLAVLSAMTHETGWIPAVAAVVTAWATVLHPDPAPARQMPLRAVG